MTARTWFYDNGIAVFPIRTPGKEPACSSWDDYTCTREDAGRFRNYGVRLGPFRHGWLNVLDTDNALAEAWVSAHVIATPFTVTTGRGVHRYYRAAGPLPKFIHRDGHTIEFRGQGQYVVGPGSVHASGAIYTAAEWSWELRDIPFFPATFVFDDRQPKANAGSRSDGYEFPEVVKAGERHHQLFCLLRSMKALEADFETTLEIVRGANQTRCQPPINEADGFMEWFERAWANPDRPFDPMGTRVPLKVDLNAQGWL